MEFNVLEDKSKISLQYKQHQLLSLFASKKIETEDLPLATLDNITSEQTSIRSMISPKQLKSGWKITCKDKNGWRNWWLNFSPHAIIFPTREGEFISNPKKLKKFHSYSLSYPGTASTKCVIVFTENNKGFLIGAEASLNWAKLSLIRMDQEQFTLKILMQEPDIYIYPFEGLWEKALDRFRVLALPHSNLQLPHKILKKPRFFLQMGIRDYFARVNIKRFSDLLPFAKSYRNQLGEGNIVHLFGTNAAGFDRMFPDFTIDPSLGGRDELKRLIDNIHSLNLLTSHHFNPRIADIHWLDNHPQYKDAIAANPSGNPWIEFYKNNIYLVMNPNNPKWQEYCLKIIKYFKNIGFDYVEIDQIAYQRNLYTEEGGFAKGYQKMIDETAKMGMKFWIEGVSDVFRLPPDCYSQVLPRDRVQFWETDENRRGYPYGTAFTRFYRHLMPFTPISFQLVTERCKVSLIPKRFSLAKKVKANIYDLELGFVDETYEARLAKTLKKLKELTKTNNT